MGSTTWPISGSLIANSASTQIREDQPGSTASASTMGKAAAM